jgi:cell division protein FtsW
LWWIPIVVIGGGAGAFAAYTFLPHVARRIDSFINPEANENYQVEKSLEAYINGGIFGKGPGEGTVKAQLPDSHTDFIFAVAGEEFGAIFGALIILLFMATVIRGIYLLSKEQSLFKIFTGAGILALFALQTIFNIGVTLHLFPTKGMTLPFISYGGSSVLSFAVSFGIFLNLTSKKFGITSTKKNSNSTRNYD